MCLPYSDGKTLQTTFSTSSQAAHVELNKMYCHM